MNNKFEIREAWLEAAVNKMMPHFKNAGYDVPPIRVSCGWPSSGGLGKKKRTLGQCWAPEASTDGKSQIFISPYLENTGEITALGVLVHEVVHAVVGIKESHNKVFGKCARSVGLEGKMTSALPGEALKKICMEWSEALGPYPHAKLDPEQRPTKKQTTRMVKMECTGCGYVCRASRKWILEMGPVSCPKHGAMTYEPFDETDEEDEAGENDEGGLADSPENCLRAYLYLKQ